jgi:hypothetical protein
MILIIVISACAPPPVAVADEEPDPTPAPISQLLANTAWSCIATSTFGSTRFDTPHHWTFTQDTFATDLPDRLIEALNSDTYPYAAGHAFETWVTYHSANGGSWEVGLDTQGGRHWFGVGARVLMLELTVPGSGDGLAYVETVDTYADSDGKLHLLMLDSDPSHAIDCVAEEP